MIGLANAKVEVRASQIEAHARHAQSLNRPSAPTSVRPPAQRTSQPTKGGAGRLGPRGLINAEVWRLH
jgi:hypothetical protein